jgi:hypothetical protein
MRDLHIESISLRLLVRVYSPSLLVAWRMHCWCRVVVAAVVVVVVTSVAVAPEQGAQFSLQTFCFLRGITTFLLVTGGCLAATAP